jgi:hypothetical protein
MPKPTPPSGFVSLKSLTHGAPDPQAALAEIRRIYFETTRQTIDHDLAHAIDLLKSLPDEEAREKASVYMEGLSQMQREWEAQTRRKGRAPARPTRPRRSPPREG